MSLPDDFFATYSPSVHLTDPKPNVILIHGLGLDSGLWAPLLPYLSDKYNVSTFDLPGHGTSMNHVPVTPLTWDILCDKFIAHLDRIQMDSVHLVGHGFGAFLAIKIALHDPQRVQSLNLISMPGFMPAEYLKRSIDNRSKFLQSNDSANLIEQLLPTLTVLHERADIRALLSQAYQQVSSADYLQMLQLFGSNDTIDDLSRTTAPNLLLCGEKDRLYPPVLSAITSSYIRHGRFQVIPDSANLVFLDQPMWTAYWLCDHIDATSAGMPAPVTDASESISDGTLALHKVIQLGDQLLLSNQQLHVQFLHTFRVTVNGSEITSGWNKRRAKQLLLYLLLFPNATRQQLYDDLWPDRELRKAQNVLRVSLSHLKSLLEQHSGRSELLRIDREHITIQGIIQCDLLDLVRDLQEAMEEEEEKAKEARIFRIWEKLPRLVLSGYVDDWILGTRDNIERQLEALEIWMADRGLRTAGCYATAVDFGNRMIPGLLQVGDTR